MRLAFGLLLLGACGPGAGADLIQPELQPVVPPPPPPPAAVAAPESPAVAPPVAPVADAGAALVEPGSDPPMLPPRALDREEEEELVLVPWKRLDAPPDFEAAVPWQEAHLHLGKRMAVEGRIVRAHNSGRACFLNFAEDWKGKFHGVIFASSFPEYPGPPEDLFLNKRVRLIGKVEEHQGAPQIVIEELRQILVLDED